MLNFEPVFVKADAIDDMWWKLLHLLHDQGKRYIKADGSFAGTEIIEFDHIFGVIQRPIQYNETGLRKSLAVTVPQGCPAPTSDEEIRDYFTNELMDSNLPPNTHYRYATWIVGGNYKLPKVEIKVPTKPDYTATGVWYDYPIKVPNQIQWCIDHYRQKGFKNNHCCITIGYPESNLAYDQDYGNEMERGTSPCMRLIDTKIMQDAAGENYLCFFVVFRAWNLWGGWPTNIGGLARLLEYMAYELGVKPGPLSFSSKAMNIYDFQLDALKSRIGK